MADKKIPKSKKVTVKKLEDYKKTKPVQLTFFDLTKPEKASYSNTIELYDAIPMSWSD